MEPWQLLAIKRSILGNLDAKVNPVAGLLDEALDQIAHINTDKYKRVRICLEFEFDVFGTPSDSLEVSYRRPRK